MNISQSVGAPAPAMMSSAPVFPALHPPPSIKSQCRQSKGLFHLAPLLACRSDNRLHLSPCVWPHHSPYGGPEPPSSSSSAAEDPGISALSGLSLSRGQIALQVHNEPTRGLQIHDCSRAKLCGGHIINMDKRFLSAASSRGAPQTLAPPAMHSWIQLQVFCLEHKKLWWRRSPSVGAHLSGRKTFALCIFGFF